MSEAQVAAVRRALSASNPAERLGVAENASEYDIRKAYRKSSILVHPDKCELADAKAAFLAIADALGMKVTVVALYGQTVPSIAAAWMVS